MRTGRIRVKRERTEVQHYRHSFACSHGNLHKRHNSSQKALEHVCIWDLGSWGVSGREEQKVGNPPQERGQLQIRGSYSAPASRVGKLLPILRILSGRGRGDRAGGRGSQC